MSNALPNVTLPASASASASERTLTREECNVGTRTAQAPHRTPPAPLERDVQVAIVHAFRLRYRVTLWHIDAGASGMRQDRRKGSRGYTGAPKGFPDLLGLIPGNGRAVFIEVKRPGQKPRPEQVAFLARLRGTGAVAFWASSVDMAMSKYAEQVAA